MNILLADDGIAAGVPLRSLIEELGHRVVGPAAGPREAVLLARRRPADVAVLALREPVEAAERLTAARVLPLVLVVAGRDPEAVGRAAHLPVFAYLVAPVSADALAPALRLARARFEERSALQTRLAELSSRLAGRTAVERAKGILMEVRGLSEGDAYQLLRRESQNRRQSLAEVASTVVSMEGVFRASVAGG